jgi:hypothetical protein
MTQLVFYTTSHCHLCEQAEVLLLSLKNQYELNWLTVEISNNDRLIKKYGLTIPVIKRSDTQTEINWPFTTNDIIKFISA